MWRSQPRAPCTHYSLDEAEGGKLWPWYRAWRDGVAADPTGERAWAAVVGGAPAQATSRWRAWVVAQRFVPGE